MKTLVGAFNQEKALVGAFSVIVKTGCGTDGSFYSTVQVRGSWWAGVVTCREELPCCRACHCQDIMCEYGHLNIGIGVRRSYPDMNSFICQKL